MPSLRIENLSKEFVTASSRISALHQLDLHANDGELLVILGPSGCGKTTLLRLIAGLEQADSGEIFLGSESISHQKPQDRRIGMAFQFPALLPQLTVAENISLGPKLRGTPAAERTARTRELAGLLAITDLLPRLPETLSGGQGQRVSLARSLATRPDLLLLDEPLANLDPTSRIQIRESIRAVQQKLRLTTLYVTHDQDEAAALADRIAILDHGRLQHLGTARELYTHPANLFVAQFFAPDPPNILSGKLHSNVFRADGSTWSIPSSVNYSGDATCVLRLSPRSIRPGEDFQASIESVQHTGWSTRLILNIQNLRLHAELPPADNILPGEAFSFSIDPSVPLFFDPSGARIIGS